MVVIKMEIEDKSCEMCNKPFEKNDFVYRLGANTFSHVTCD